MSQKINIAMWGGGGSGGGWSFGAGGGAGAFVSKTDESVSSGVTLSSEEADFTSDETYKYYTFDADGSFIVNDTPLLGPLPVFKQS